VASSIEIREVKMSDVAGLVDLYASVGWKLSEKQAYRIVDFSINCDYSRILVAELNGKVLGKVTLDTVFPPYAEIVNIIVHPNYQGRGIGSRLIEKCINIAVKLGHNIVYLMCDPSDIKMHRFYARIGFKPAILGNPKKPRSYMWLYYFGGDSIINNFLVDHPFAEFQVSKRRKIFHKLKVYSMKWKDPVTGDRLEVLVKGQPGQPLKNGIMPRIAGMKLQWGNTKIDCWTSDESFENHRGQFKLNIKNHSEKEKSIEIRPLIRKDMELVLKYKPNIILNPRENLEVIGEVKLTENFKVKLNYLSFPTVIASVILKIDRGVNFVVSSGFNLSSA